MRSGKGRKARRVPLHPDAVRTLERYLLIRCPTGLPAVGSDAERAPLLVVCPGLAIFLTALSVTWIGQGLSQTGDKP